MSVDREFVSMSENLVRSLKHFEERLRESVDSGSISPEAAGQVRTNAMTIVSHCMTSIETLSRAKSPVPK